ncbi:MAG: HlyD family efflux transporter periplasmic adaptor subunit [bacterium]
MRLTKIFIITIPFFILNGCNTDTSKNDANGNFESTEIMVSAEASGKIIGLKLEEGQNLNSNQIVGKIDTTELYLQKKQIEATISALDKKLPDPTANIEILKSELENAQKEKLRSENLFKANSITQQQYDNVLTQVDVLERKIKAENYNAAISSKSILSEKEPLLRQIDQINEKISKCNIINPIQGCVIGKYHEQGEMIVAGNPIYKIADLRTLNLRAYVTENQIHQIKIGQNVKIFVDKSDGNYKEYRGILTWISDQSEFTPKMIQTKEERVNFVYAIKIKVENDGGIKIGMPAEVKFEGDIK